MKDPNEASKHYCLSDPKALFFYERFATILSESEQREILKCQKFRFWPHLRIKAWKIFPVCSQNAKKQDMLQKCPQYGGVLLEAGALRTDRSSGLSPRCECNMLLTQLNSDI